MMEHRAEIAAVEATAGFDALVIGGGINGISVFRDLALQGTSVLLVERGDFVSGASAASSHMVHGGVRYLENGEFRLVRESVQERNRLLANAPHRVRPLQTTIPIRTATSGILAAPLRMVTHRRVPKERGAALIKLGLSIYDTFSRGGRLPRHRFLGRTAAHQELPALDPRFAFTATYFDASMPDPERLALDVLRDGIEDGGIALNYVEAIGARDGRVQLKDRITGRLFDVSASVIVNASGPWTDQTNDTLGVPTRYMGGTKGSHIVLDNPELLEATHGREIFFEHTDGRVVLIYPLHGRVLVGTTDLDADARQAAVCTEDEVDYFFDLIADVFPNIPVDRSQIVYRFAGIRPLPRHDDVAPGFVSRDYRVVRGEVSGVPLLSLVGGKWTTFRALGEHLTDEVLRLLQRDRRSTTMRLKIGGGDGFPADDNTDEWIGTHLGDVDARRAKVLLERYGTRAVEAAAEIAACGDEDEVILGGALSTGELRYQIRHEHAFHLLDVLLRRTNLAFTGRVNAETIEIVGSAMQKAAGWDDARLNQEIEEAAVFLEDFHGLVLRTDHGVRL